MMTIIIIIVFITIVIMTTFNFLICYFNLLFFYYCHNSTVDNTTATTLILLLTWINLPCTVFKRFKDLKIFTTTKTFPYTTTATNRNDCLVYFFSSTFSTIKDWKLRYKPILRLWLSSTDCPYPSFIDVFYIPITLWGVAFSFSAWIKKS